MTLNYKKLGPWSLRIGLAAIYLYSGPDLIANPQNWVGYLPEWLGLVTKYLNDLEA